MQPSQLHESERGPSREQRGPWEGRGGRNNLESLTEEVVSDLGL